eukprot:4141547-Amphidinium_carterae.1
MCIRDSLRLCVLPVHQMGFAEDEITWFGRQRITTVVPNFITVCSAIALLGLQNHICQATTQVLTH